MTQPKRIRTVNIVVDEDGQPLDFPRRYDVKTDSRVPVTQDDVDRWIRIENALFAIRRVLKAFDEGKEVGEFF